MPSIKCTSCPKRASAFAVFAGPPPTTGMRGLPEELHAIHGGALALNVSGLGCVGALIISGLPQVDDHLFAVEVVTEFLARKGEQQ